VPVFGFELDAELDAQFVQPSFGQGLADFGKQAADKLKELEDAAKKAAGSPFQWLTGLPLWAWALIALGGVGLVGYIGFKLLGTSAASAVATRFMPLAL